MVSNHSTEPRRTRRDPSSSTAAEPADPDRSSPAQGHRRQDHFGDRLRRHLEASAAQTCSRRRLRKNEYLYTSGERASSLYLVETGRIKTLMHSACGKGCLLGIFSRGDVVGESCLLGGERAETAAAMRPTVLTRFPRDWFLDLLASEGLLEDWLRYLTARLSEQQQIITLLVTVDSEQRLAATLQRLARKLGVRCGDQVRIEQKITHEELSEMVGTTRSRIGYFLKKFRTDGLLENTAEPFLIVNERRLAEYIDTRSQLRCPEAALDADTLQLMTQN